MKERCSEEWTQNLQLQLIFGSLKLTSASGAALVLREHLKPQAVSANVSWGSGQRWGTGPLWGKGGLIEGRTENVGLVKLGVMRSCCVSQGLKLTAAARWRVQVPVCLSWTGRCIRRAREMTLDDQCADCTWVGFTARVRVVMDGLDRVLHLVDAHATQPRE